MDLDLELVQDIVGDISIDATNDLKVFGRFLYILQLETSLESLKQELSTTEFRTEACNDDFNIITNFPEAMDVFQDHLITCDRLLLQATSQNLFLRIEMWSRKLLKGQEILVLMERLQDLFTDLNPLFEIQEYATHFSKDETDDFSASKKVMIMMVSAEFASSQLYRVTLYPETGDL